MVARRTGGCGLVVGAGVVMRAFLWRQDQEVSNRLVAPLPSLAGVMMSPTRAASSP